MNRTDVDLHVHTVTSGCGYTTHRQVLDLARAAGRGVIAVTDHDTAAGGSPCASWPSAAATTSSFWWGWS